MGALNPERALIFRITHVDNVPWVLANGLHCRNSTTLDPGYREIGNLDLIARRAGRIVPIPPGGTLSDYIPFYFTPYSPMLLNIKTGYGGVAQAPMSDIVILMSSLHLLRERSIAFVFTDRHAYLRTADSAFSSDLADLARIDWPILCARDFRRDPNDPGKFERYQAEALVHRHLPVEALTCIGCHGHEQKLRLQAQVEAAGLSTNVSIKPGWYF